MRRCNQTELSRPRLHACRPPFVSNLKPLSAEGSGGVYSGGDLLAPPPSASELTGSRRHPNHCRSTVLMRAALEEPLSASEMPRPIDQKNPLIQSSDKPNAE